MAWTFLRVYFDQIQAWEALGDSERGRLLLAALQYAASEKLPEFKGNERYQWPQIKAQIDREKEAYLGKVKKCSEAGKASAEARQIQRMSTDVNDRCFSLTKEQEQEQDNTRHSKEKKAKEKKEDAFEVFSGDNEELLTVLKAFEAMRVKIKKPLTDYAKARLLGNLQANFKREDWIPVLEQSIFHSWQDIYPLKEDQPQKKKQYTTASEYQRPTTIDANALERIKADFNLDGGG